MKASDERGIPGLFGARAFRVHFLWTSTPKGPGAFVFVSLAPRALMRLPSRAMRRVHAYLGGAAYWARRKRLSELHLWVDLVTCDVFRAWADSCAWATWRERNPKVAFVPTASASLFPWACLPPRFWEDGGLRVVSGLQPLRARLDGAAALGHAERAAWVRHFVRREARAWETEAADLRVRVHGFV